MKKGLFLAAALAVLCGCQSALTARKNAEVILPMTRTTTAPDGTVTVEIIRYMVASGGWEVKARSPLYAEEALKGFGAEIGTNGFVKVGFDAYTRDLSPNSVQMVKTIFDGSTNLVAAIGKAYAMIASGGSTEAVSAVANKAAAYFKEKGGDASKSQVICENGVCSVSDGNVCIVCDANGNCSEGTCGE